MSDDLQDKARAARKQRGWTQERAAQEAGVSLRAYQMFETGKARPQDANMRSILRALELDRGSADTAAATRSGWPVPVQVFLDMIGAYLMTMDEETQLEVMSDVTRKIFRGSQPAV